MSMPNTPTQSSRSERQRLWAEIRSRWPLFVLGFAFLAFYLDYSFAPWEMAYRQRAVVVVRAQLDALPTVDGVEADSYLTDSEDDILVMAQYPRRTFCNDVIAHYRQMAPISGWTFDRREQSSNGPIDYYTGVFQGYHLSLVIDCDTTQLGYRVDGSVPFPYAFALVGWITGTR